MKFSGFPEDTSPKHRDIQLYMRKKKLDEEKKI